MTAVRGPAPRWRGKRVLITAGPTREHLDPVRFISNASSGAMGFALASEAARRGASVVVVCGPVPCVPDLPGAVAVVPVVSALDMRREVLARCARADVVIAAAAVGDWRFEKTSRSKIKRSAKRVRLTLVPNPDIIADTARRIGRLGRRAVLVGFALETSKAVERAREKLRRKGLDLVVANGPASMGGAFAEISLVGRNGDVVRAPRVSKEKAARLILDRVEGVA